MSACIWAQDGEGEDAWDTGCRNRFMLTEGTPSDNRMAFCCYCGKTIEEHIYTEEEAQP
jgi:hypothetical protein